MPQPRENRATARGNGGRNKQVDTPAGRYRSRDEEILSRLLDERDHRSRVARRARRPQARAAPHPRGHERPWPGLEPRLSQMRQNLRRHFRQLPSARRSCHLSRAGPSGSRLQHALPADRRSGEFRLCRRRSASGHAVHGSAPREAQRRHSGRSRKRNGRFRSQL